jgi:hypothetical protein
MTKYPTIQEMKLVAETMIAAGDDGGLLALYWIKKWIKADNEGGILKDPESGNVSHPHPSNIAHRFNYPNDLEHYWVPGAAWVALVKVWETAGGVV